MANIPIKGTENVNNFSAKKIIMYGPGGSGKSAGIATVFLDNPDARVIYLMTERNAVSGLEFGLKHHGINLKPEQLIYVFPEEKVNAFANLSRALTSFKNESKTDGLKGKPQTTQGKEHYGYLLKIIDQLQNFKGQDYITGKEVSIGNVGQLKENDVLVVDGLSPIGKEVWNATAGDKILIAQSDYLPAQNLMYGILAELAKLRCHVILLAHHKDKMEDEKFIETQVNTWVGNANYGTLMGLFTDVIWVYKLGDKTFKWAGMKNKVYTIARNFPAKDMLEPNFKEYNIFSKGA